MQGGWVKTRFLLDAGHLGPAGSIAYRARNPNWNAEEKRSNAQKIGHVARNAYLDGAEAVDALALKFNQNGLAPRQIIEGSALALGPGSVGPARVAWKGELLCTSGASTGHVECGYVKGFQQANWNEEHPQHSIGIIFVKGMKVMPGDSGAPVWDPNTHAAVGMVVARPHQGSPNSEVAPLLTTPYGKRRKQKLVGALNATIMGQGELHVIQGG